jgi:ATP-dependent DNA helicase RecG
MLLFGRNPQRLLPQSGAVLVHFAGTQPAGGEGLPGYMRREEINGPLSQVIETLWNTIWEEIRHESVIAGLKREERPEYPPFAVREAIVNAVAHRDYRVPGRRIEVRMFDDRMEIISPGGLPGHITLDNIVEEHFSRNPRIVKGLFYWGFIEELGLGIDRMIDEMIQAGHPAPQFEARPFTFRVTLRNVRERPVSKWAQSLNERQIKALGYLQERGRITNREYRDLCPEVTSETLRLDLANMVDKGVLLRIGDKKGTYYILK